jgi:pyruvate dehydrogenase E2 component (dihydrolipoamide acetyltransferase)
LKAAGAHVEVGEELVDIETDKATVTYESPAAGLFTIVAEEGSTHVVGAVIATVGPQAEVTSARAGGEPSADEPALSPNGHADVTVAVSATPMARRVAAVHGVDLADVPGTGPNGRVTKRDAALAAGVTLEATTPAIARPVGRSPAPTAPTPATATAVAETAKGAHVEELTRIQQVIARRMSEAKASVPDFQIQTEVVMDAAVAMRGELKKLGGDAVPSVNDIVVKACALALRKHPRANGSYRDGRFELHTRINVGVAVAAQNALVVPTVTDAESRSLGDIAREIRRLAKRVRDGSITPPELSGGTFTVSNLGMYGVTAMWPVINPPQAAILGVGAMRAVLALVDGSVVEQQVLTLTLSCDHRILYGADAAACLATIRELLEAPISMAL